MEPEQDKTSSSGSCGPSSASSSNSSSTSPSSSPSSSSSTTSNSSSSSSHSSSSSSSSSSSHFSSSDSSSSSSPSSSSSVTAFLSKLWRLVNDNNSNELICWSQSGCSFVILNHIQFAKDLLPLYFKHSNMASFIRQLNMYGFRKIPLVGSNGTGGGGSSSSGAAGSAADQRTDVAQFYHVNFIRGQEQRLACIKRKNNASKTHNLIVNGTFCDEVRSILNDVKSIRDGQNSSESILGAIQVDNKSLWRDVAILRSQHHKQRRVIEKLIQFLLSLIQNRNNNIVSKKRKVRLMIDDVSGGGGGGGGGTSSATATAAATCTVMTPTPATSLGGGAGGSAPLSPHGYGAQQHLAPRSASASSAGTSIMGSPHRLASSQFAAIQLATMDQQQATSLHGGCSAGDIAGGHHDLQGLGAALARSGSGGGGGGHPMADQQPYASDFTGGGGGGGGGSSTRSHNNSPIFGEGGGGACQLQMPPELLAVGVANENINNSLLASQIGGANNNGYQQLQLQFSNGIGGVGPTTNGGAPNSGAQRASVCHHVTQWTANSIYNTMIDGVDGSHVAGHHGTTASASASTGMDAFGELRISPGCLGSLDTGGSNQNNHPSVLIHGSIHSNNNSNHNNNHQHHHQHQLHHHHHQQHSFYS